MPEPDGPTRATSSPSAIDRSTSAEGGDRWRARILLADAAELDDGAHDGTTTRSPGSSPSAVISTCPLSNRPGSTRTRCVVGPLGADEPAGEAAADPLGDGIGRGRTDVVDDLDRVTALEERDERAHGHGQDVLARVAHDRHRHRGVVQVTGRGRVVEADRHGQRRGGAALLVGRGLGHAADRRHGPVDGRAIGQLDGDGVADARPARRPWRRDRG